MQRTLHWRGMPSASSCSHRQTTCGKSICRCAMLQRTLVNNVHFTCKLGNFCYERG